MKFKSWAIYIIYYKTAQNITGVLIGKYKLRGPLQLKRKNT